MTTMASEVAPLSTAGIQYRPLGRTGMNVSSLSFGASSLGGVFRDVNEAESIAAVHCALDLGINYFDVAPAYGGTRAEAVLGRALKGVPRDRFYLSTKVGKYTNPDAYGEDHFDYSRARIRASLDESARRLGFDYFDIVHIHDIEYEGRRHVEWALREGVEALQELQREGRVGAVSFGIHPMDLWHRVLTECDVQAALVHNHYCLNDTRLLELLPIAADRGIGIINGSPFASGLLTDRGPAAWHPAGEPDRAVFRRAALHCASRGTSISRLALQFSSQHPEIPTTLFSSASAESVRRNVAWHCQPADPEILAQVLEILRPVRDKDWSY
jgi:L-galactose dehydrogenase